MTKLIDVKVGDVLVADDHFHCLKVGSENVVRKNAIGELYIDCNMGKHHLIGQHDEKTGELIGLTVKL